MTIDEIIVSENELGKQAYRIMTRHYNLMHLLMELKDLKTGKTYPYPIYCDLDEMIKYYQTVDCPMSKIPENTQIVEWLQELKKLRNG